MNEENKGTGATDNNQGNQAGTVTMEQVQAMIAENDRKWQSKFDAKNTELQKLRREKMTDEERAKSEIAEEKARLEAERATFREERFKSLRSIGVTGKGLPADFADYVGGADEKEITARVEKLHALIEAEVSKRVQAEIYGKGAAPKSGDPIDPTDDQAYMAAKFQKLNG